MGEGIHINSSNGAQSSLIFNGNIQGVNIGIHVISTNQGLIVENTDTGSPVGTGPAFLQIECSVAGSPTLINNEVEGNTSAVIDHGINPARQCNSTDQASTCGGACEPACSQCKLGTAGNPVWLNNTWNNHPIKLDGTEHITSIGNLLNQGTIESAQASVTSIDETGWSTGGTATDANLGSIGGILGATGGAVFGASLIDRDVIIAEDPSSCPGFPTNSDFIEFTIGPTSFNGDTTRVDQFGIKLAMNLTCGDGTNIAVGENSATFAESRASTFERFINQVQSPFQVLAESDAPYAILSPGSGGFDTGGPYETYYNAYISQIWADNNLTIPIAGDNGDGLGAYPDLSAAIYRHTAAAGTFNSNGTLVSESLWGNPNLFYQVAPTSYYAQWFHANAINGQQDAFPYDDAGGYSSDVGCSNPTSLVVAVGW